MKLRKVLIGLLTLIMVAAALTATNDVMAEAQAAVVKQSLDNVRAYAPAASSETPAYAVDGGALFANENGVWALVDTPENVIVNAVTTDGGQLYIGAANEMAIYRSDDNGQSWLRVPLTDEYVGGVTSLAVDSAQRVVYVGTDTAGLFRLRDVGPSMIVTSHLLLNEPVREVVADSTGAGMAFARTDWNVYRAENMGLRWETVGDLGSAPTALALVNTDPATVYVGTTDRGLLKSNDGLTWTTANEGLGMAPGARLKIDALAADPQQPGVLYAATSYLLGSTTVHQTPVAVAMSTDNAQAWTPLESLDSVAVAELMPVAGQPGAVYALMVNDRTPLAMGDAPVMNLAASASPAANADVAQAASVAPVEKLSQGEALTAQAAAEEGTNSGDILAWIIAGLAGAALLFALFSDLGKGQGGRKASAGKGLAPTLANK